MATKTKTKGNAKTKSTSTKAKAANGAPRQKRARKDGGMSLINAAAQVLRGSDPMSAGDIYDKVIAKGLWTPGKGETPKNTLSAAMRTEISKKGAESRFKLVEKGRFALA